LFVLAGQVLAALGAAIAPSLIRPGMAVHAEPEPTKLAEHRCAVRFKRGGARTRIVMDVVHITNLHVIPAAGTIDQPARIMLFDQPGEAGGIELPPAFVENHPHDDARMVVQAVEHAPELELELPGRLGGADDLTLTRPDVAVAAWHILPDQQP